MDSERARVVAEARTWLSTPFYMNGMVKGAGVDCLRLIWRSFVGAGVLKDPGYDPWPQHSVQWSQHHTEEVLVGYVQQYAHEVQREHPLPADIVLIKRHDDLCYAHGGLVTSWPRLIHVMDRSPGVVETSMDVLRRLNVELRYFSVWV